MTAVMLRSPLHPLSMSHSQRPTLRRSARHAFDDEDIPFPAAKRSKSSKADTVTIAAQEKDAATSSAPNGAKKAAVKKGKLAYDENDDGFQFSRTKLKKSTTQTPSEEPSHASEGKTQTVRRKRASIPPPEPAERQEDPRRRRSKRLSGEKAPTPRGGKSKSQQTNGTSGRPASPSQRETSAQPRQQSQKHSKGVQQERDGSPMAPSSPFAMTKKRDGTKIALPFADTPIIKRNKELRKTLNGGRRSSSGMRGRRASSLIESGSSNGGHDFNNISSADNLPNTVSQCSPSEDLTLIEDAVPHADVDAQDFYKLIEQSIPEPRRMKQLLTWCGTRALPSKTGEKSKDATEVVAVETARHIQDELLKDFANKPELSDWFSREDDAPTAVLVKRPNPRNTQNTVKLQQLESEIKRLQDEKRAWDTLLSNPPLPPAPLSNQTNNVTSQIDATLLDDPTQSSILDLLRNSTNSAMPTSLIPRPAKRGTHAEALHPPTQRDEVQQRLRSLAQSLEPSVDIFADGVHKLAQYRLAAERVADKALADGARVLDERDRAVREASGTVGIGGFDALKALGGLLGRR